MYQKNPLLLHEIFGFNDAVTYFDESKLDHKKIQILLKYPDLLKALDEWILVPNRNLLPKLKQLSLIVDKLYTFNYNSKIYRGFRKNSIQDTMGLTNRGFFIDTLKRETAPGYEFTYKVTNPLSFSTDLNIAKAFGKIVIETKLPKHNKLVITNELAHIINKMRNLKKDTQTQYEVIVFPDNILNCKIIRT